MIGLIGLNLSCLPWHFALTHNKNLNGQRTFDRGLKINNGEEREGIKMEFCTQKKNEKKTCQSHN